MKKNKKHEHTTEKFLSSMNTSFPLMLNIINANYDKMVYGWGNQVFKKLLTQIYETYDKEKLKKRKSKE